MRLALLLLWAVSLAAVPTDNPCASYELAWTSEIHWHNVLDITTVDGQNWDAKIATGQEALTEQGGGVLFFPAGEYVVRETILLKSGIVLRGADPVEVTKASDVAFAPGTILQFPAYAPSFEGEGTANDTAFKGIHLEDVGTASNCGLVHLQLNHAHIEYGETEDHQAGKNRLVVGCVVQNAAVPNDMVPAPSQNQWQRFTKRDHAALQAYCGENMLLANNRLPQADANFIMKDFKMYMDSRSKTNVLEHDTIFDYDFRPGIAANQFALSAEATPQNMPWGFRRGLVIRDNFIYGSGGPAILFTGDGTICSFNVIRFKKKVARETTVGIHRGDITNHVRAIEMRGHRWTVEGNHYIVYPNVGPIGPDGDGIMHIAESNTAVVDSKIINNTGNAYIGIWRVPINGLEIRGNKVATDSRHGAISVLGATRRHETIFSVKNVVIAENETINSGVMVVGDGENITIRGNTYKGAKGKNMLWNFSGAETVVDNVGFKLHSRNLARSKK